MDRGVRRLRVLLHREGLVELRQVFLDRLDSLIELLDVVRDLLQPRGVFLFLPFVSFCRSGFFLRGLLCLWRAVLDELQSVDDDVPLGVLIGDDHDGRLLLLEAEIPQGDEEPIDRRFLHLVDLE